MTYRMLTYLTYSIIQMQDLKLKRTFRNVKSDTKMVYFFQFKVMYQNMMVIRQRLCVYNSEAVYVPAYTLSRIRITYNIRVIIVLHYRE